jgi:DNA-binding transcriptional MerR regulator
MHIGSVAKKIGLTPDAIRFYERNALLSRAPRTPGGFREYVDGDIETLGFIRQVQGLGFTLKEVREFLDLRRNRLQPCAPVCRRLEKKLLQLRRKLEDLQKLEHELQMVFRTCKREVRKRNARCPLLHGTKQGHRKGAA